MKKQTYKVLFSLAVKRVLWLPVWGGFPPWGTSEMALNRSRVILVFPTCCSKERVQIAILQDWLERERERKRRRCTQITAATNAVSKVTHISHKFIFIWRIRRDSFYSALATWIANSHLFSVSSFSHTLLAWILKAECNCYLCTKTDVQTHL